MVIECLDGGVVRLTEPNDFCRFKLVLYAVIPEDAHSWDGITLLDDRNALVSIDLVPNLAGRHDDASWDRQYAEMVAKAREHGWVDSEQRAIRAHIERIP